MARLEWKAQAACRGLDTTVFFSDDEADTAAAIAVCENCPVRQACLDFAIDTRQHDGIWGGLTEIERRRVRRRRQAGGKAA
jgi:WhiB family redox-sensing transcriptional regulator